MKELLLTTVALFLMSISYGQELRKSPIEIQETISTKTYSSGEQKIKITYQYRYTSDVQWKNCGRNFKNLEPILSQFEGSKKLYQKSKRVRLVSAISLGVGLAGAATAIVFAQLEDKKRWGVIIGSGAVGLTGIIYGLIRFNKSNDIVLDAVDEYNRLVTLEG